MSLILFRHYNFGGPAGLFGGKFCAVRPPEADGSDLAKALLGAGWPRMLFFVFRGYLVRSCSTGGKGLTSAARLLNASVL